MNWNTFITAFMFAFLLCGCTEEWNMLNEEFEETKVGWTSNMRIGGNYVRIDDGKLTVHCEDREEMNYQVSCFEDIDMEQPFVLQGTWKQTFENDCAYTGGLVWGDIPGDYYVFGYDRDGVVTLALEGTRSEIFFQGHIDSLDLAGYNTFEVERKKTGSELVFKVNDKVVFRSDARITMGWNSSSKCYGFLTSSHLVAENIRFACKQSK